MENDGLTTGNPQIDKAVAKVPPYDATRPYPVLEPLWEPTVITRVPNEAVAVATVPPCTIYRYGTCPGDIPVPPEEVETFNILTEVSGPMLTEDGYNFIRE